MKVIGHQTVAEQLEGIAALSLSQGLQEGEVITLVSEDVGSVVPTIERVVNEPLVDCTR